MSSFRKASKKQSRLRMAICAPPGGGKTFTALRFAMALKKPDGKICVINTESGAVEKYLGLNPDGSTPFDFDIAEMPDFSPTRYTQLITEAGSLGYDVIIVDSLSHAWAGSGGALELKDKKGGNSFTAWKDITPMHNAMIEAILRSPAHVIATMRTKVAYVLEEQTNKAGAIVQVPKKVGMEPIQRQGMEYEFDIVADMDNETHTLKVTKSRCPAVDGLVSVKPGAEFVQPVKLWLEEGVAVDPGYYAVRPEDLNAVRQEAADNQSAANDAAAAEARRRELLAMANQGAVAGVSAATTVRSGTAVSATTEQPPFDGGTQVASAVAAAPAASTDPLPSPEQLQELVALGAMIQRTPQDIFKQCKELCGCGPDKLPQSRFLPLLESFRKCAAEAQQTQQVQAKNQSAA